MLDLDHRALAGLGTRRPPASRSRRRGRRPRSAGASPPASARSRVIGVRWTGGVDARERLLERARRSRLRACRAGRARRPRAGRRRRTTAGVSRASFATRDAAGCSRSCSASKSSPSRRRDHDLAVDHAALGQARATAPRELGKVAIERPQVAALDEDVARRRGRRSRESRPTSARTASRRPRAARPRASPASARSAARWGTAPVPSPRLHLIGCPPSRSSEPPRARACGLASRVIMQGRRGEGKARRAAGRGAAAARGGRSRRGVCQARTPGR